MSNNEQIKAAVRGRAGLKTRLTNFEKYLQGVQAQVAANLERDPPVFFNELTIGQMSDRLSKIEPINELFESYQREIENLVSDKNYENEVGQRQIFDDLYFALVAQAKQMLGQRCPSRLRFSTFNSFKSQSSSSNSKVKITDDKVAIILRFLGGLAGIRGNVRLANSQARFTTDRKISLSKAQFGRRSCPSH
jgi:hypothetical protein